MRKSTKTLFLPAHRSLRQYMHTLDKQKRVLFEPGLRGQMEASVKRPKWLTQCDGRKVEYMGP